MTDAERLLKEKYGGIKTSEYEADLVQLELGVPLAYLIGHIPFLDTKIFLDSRPLIPRTETEFWVEKVIEKISDSNCKVLDLFAGSGCIGVAILKHNPHTTVDFGELDSLHLLTIQKNIGENGIEESRTRIIQTDVFENISDSYDVICANPPYLSRNRAERVEQSVQEYEPAEALFADDDGEALLNQCIDGLSQHLKKGGIAYLEHEPEQEASIKERALKNGLRAESFEDQYEVVRYSTLTFEVDKRETSSL